MLFEPVAILDTYADDLFEVQDLGSNVRLVYATHDLVTRDQFVVAKIIRPKSTLTGSRSLQLLREGPKLIRSNMLGHH